MEGKRVTSRAISAVLRNTRKERSMTKLCFQDVVTRPDVHPDEQQTLFVFQGNRRRAHVP
jgi:hypothetical protein